MICTRDTLCLFQIWSTFESGIDILRVLCDPNEIISFSLQKWRPETSICIGYFTRLFCEEKKNMNSIEMEINVHIIQIQYIKWQYDGRR